MIESGWMWAPFFTASQSRFNLISQFWAWFKGQMREVMGFLFLEDGMDYVLNEMSIHPTPYTMSPQIQTLCTRSIFFL
jgi:hypothetical protein